MRARLAVSRCKLQWQATPTYMYVYIYIYTHTYFFSLRHPSPACSVVVFAVAGCGVFVVVIVVDDCFLVSWFVCVAIDLIGCLCGGVSTHVCWFVMHVCWFVCWSVGCLVGWLV